MLTIGIDSSTQGTKAVVYDNSLGKVVFSSSVNYGRDFPEYASPDGFIPNDDTRVRHADPEMWIRALELVLKRLQESGAPMGDIAAIGGDAQQHATVYLGDNGFSRKTSPIWMDSSTSMEVALLDKHFGKVLQERTGSPAIERFAASQVMKFLREEPKVYENTKRIHLLSSFLTSVLTGEDAPIDIGDGAGMNLLNLRSLEWDKEICDFISPDLLQKLPRIYRPGDPPLKLAERFAAFGLTPGINVVPFTGDNPSSLVGCGAAKPGTAVISLGTSDTFFAAMNEFHTDPAGYGHVFGNPSGGFMSLACFKNGSLARDKVRSQCGVDWKFFDETAFELTEAGNCGKRSFAYFETEITPKHDATGIESNFDWEKASNEVRIRSLVEGQINNMYEHTRWIGDFDTILVTGGASRSRGIRSVIEDIFKAEVKTLEVTDSAAIGGAILAAVSIMEKKK
jgi:xylulokinase